MPVYVHIAVTRKNLGFLKKGFKRFFLYENRTRKYSKNATEKHPVYGTLYLTKYKSPVSQRKEHRVKNEINESNKLRLKLEYEVYLLKYTINMKNLKKT